jgi:5-(carboxyamino)imidazole ribonucleotide synthase
MDQLVTSSFKLGIIGGGQLGKMLTQAASTWDVQTYILDPSLNCPCSSICTKLIIGDFMDFDSIYQFGQSVDVITYELENINIEALKELKKEGKKIYPDPDALTIIQDKGLQKLFYQENNIESPAFRIFDTKEELIAAVEANEIQIPFVQKSRRGGYDGRGVFIVRKAEDLQKLIEGPSIVENKVDLDKEIGVIVHRNTKGQIAAFPAVEMEFNPKTNQVEQLICPAAISNDLEDEALKLAETVVKCFDFCGTLAVEMFLDKTGKLWVNEVAPRPHNSGHHTIESIITSQYEQHLRAIFGFPLGSTKIKMPAVMINLLGEPGYSGPAKYEGLTSYLGIEGVKVHIYGKAETRPHRKMGHITVLAHTLEEAKTKAEQVKKHIKVTAWEHQK